MPAARKSKHRHPPRDPMAELAARYSGPDLRRDVVLWAKTRLGIDLWSMQGRIANDQNKRVYVRSCHDSGKCAAADDWLPLADGTRIRFGDAIGRDNLVVWSWNPDTGEQVPAPASATDNGVQPVIAVTTEWGRRIRRTAEHPLWMSRGSAMSRWCAVADLTVGDGVLTPTFKAPHQYHWENVASLILEDPVPTVALSVPGFHTYLTEFVEHNTFLAAVKACHHIDTHPIGTARVVSTAPTQDQVIGLLWVEINQLFELAERRGNPLPGRVNQSEWWIGSYLAGVGRKPSDYDPKTFQGYHSRWPLIIADEADALRADIWDALGTLLTNDDARLFAIGNPDDPTSYFRKLQKGAEALGHAVYQIRAEDTPNFTGEDVTDYVKGVLLGKEWVRERIRMWGGTDALDLFNATGDHFACQVDHPFWTSKVMAEYSDESNLTIVRASDVLVCMESNDTEPFGTVALGVDVAGSEHGDETVVQERRGRHALRRWGIRSADPEVIADFMVECATESGCTQLTIDAGGVGFGFVAVLRRRLPLVAIIPFNFGAGASNKTTFLNARAELYWHMRVMSRDRTWDLSRMEDAEETVAQVTSVRRKEAAKKIQVEDKDEVRKRIGRSPDNADALGMAFYSGAAGGEARVSSPADVQIPTGADSVIRVGSGVGAGMGSASLPTGSTGLTRGAL